MPRNIHRLLVPEAVLVLVALLVFASDMPQIGWLINPHSNLGGGVLLVLLGLCSVSLGWLILIIPGAAFGLIRGNIEREVSSVVVVCVGAVLAVIYGGWFVHTFVLRS